MARAKIEDVAEKAGVSVATVDRVLNARAAVRPHNAKRVEAAIRALNYHPDRLAARLAKGREYRFAFVLPSGSNEFMRGLAQEIRSNALHLEAGRIEADILHVDVFDPAALAATLRDIKGYDGIAVVALDHPQVREAINQHTSSGTPVVTLVSDVPASARAHFVGIDNSAAGRTAATLMGRYLGARQGKVGIIAGALALRDHAERSFGFGQVMGSEYPHLTLLPVMEARDDATRTRAVTMQLLESHADLVGIYNLGAGTEGIVEALSALGRGSDVTVIAHELNAMSRRALMDGVVDVIIAQNTGHQARSAMRVLVAKCDRAPIIAAQEHISIDIFVRDNLP
jgi:LacI family transcriptional regulator